MSINHERRLRALEAAVSNLAREIAEIRTDMKEPEVKVEKRRPGRPTNAEREARTG